MWRRLRISPSLLKSSQESDLSSSVSETDDCKNSSSHPGATRKQNHRAHRMNPLFPQPSWRLVGQLLAHFTDEALTAQRERKLSIEAEHT